MCFHRLVLKRLLLFAFHHSKFRVGKGARFVEDGVRHFHFANVVDDFEMGITHIIRGEDHISNTPRQILIAEAIGAPRPIYAHIPLILAKDRSKLSKRHGAVSTTEYRDKGYLPEALINYLALLGWNPGGEQEIFSKDELIKLFSLNKIQKGGAIFNEEKLRWINREHLLKLSNAEKEKNIKLQLNKKWDISSEFLSKITPVIFERIEVWNDIEKMIKDGEFDYFFEKPIYDSKSLLWKKETDSSNTLEHLKFIFEIFSKISAEKLDKDSAKNAIWDYAEQKGRGSVLWPLRYALSGKEKSPDPFTLIEILGKDETLKRIKKAIEILS